MSFAVVTVNYRTPALTVECLKSLAGDMTSETQSRVFVIDNASGDDSIPMLSAAIEREGWSRWAELISMPRNGGFSYGNNAGIRAARSRDPNLSFVMLLNPDTRIYPGIFTTFEAFFRGRPSAGIAGAGIDNPAGRAEPAAHIFPSPLGELEAAAAFSPLSRLLRRFAVTPEQSDLVHRCDWVSGACMAVKPAVFDQIGYLDEDFFLYFEEVDFCRRAGLSGWECWYVPDARIIHYEGASTGIKNKRKRRSSFWYDSRRRFFAKHYGVAGLLAADTLWAIGSASLSMRFICGFGGRAGIENSPLYMARDMLIGDGAAILRGALTSRTLSHRY